MSVTNPYITVFTPCYNGAETIREVAKCVDNQTFKSFEWIIYNDGSSDDSDAAIREIIATYPHLNILYINERVNRGKHIAWNRAVEIANGELFICADADDTFETDSFQFFFDKWQEIKDKEKCCGILGLVDSLESGTLHAGKWPKDGWESNYLEFEIKHRIKGETWGVTRTDLLRQRKFPELVNGCFAEHYIWYWIALAGYNYFCFNHVTRHYLTMSNGSLMATRKKRLVRPQQLQISLLVLLWDLKYLSSWYIKYDKIGWLKMIAKLLVLICYYLFRSDKSRLI